ncbi:MAG: asparaginase [Deltaproteobacteria bacterium]|nr:asparaginase [Deltaproteobacteria bacterium]MBW1951809.1 asparaginase [Deltaproteobacteria bacterium]MBW1985625.1 asparaginase [Deltaproteobacteria bacterium]MBW2134435.1 asparaginase [Deltaproteobacteria bacterium]
MAEILVKVTRGDRVESVHYGHIAVVDGSGRLLHYLGDPDLWVCLRSMAKPLQALPVLLTGAAAAFGFGPEELAIFCGSLSGQDFHVAVVQRVLDRLGLTVDHLQCGIHPPSHRPTAQALAQAGLKPTPLHNNCAGKHAAMLALCVHQGWSLDDYLDPQHPVQQLVLDTIAQVTGVPRQEITVAIDGCGVPVFYVPLRQIAWAYAQLAAAATSRVPANPVMAGLATLMQASLAHPRLIAGDGRLCTDVMQALPNKVFAKTGAEGGYALALLDSGLGVAIKISDGHPRGLNPTVIEILNQLGILIPTAATALASYYHPPIRNHLKNVVGEVRPEFNLV